METLKKEQIEKEKNPFLHEDVETPVYCPCCFARGDRLDAWFFMSEVTHEYLSVRAQCNGCGGEWWAVYSLMSITPMIPIEDDERVSQTPRLSKPHELDTLINETSNE